MSATLEALERTRASISELIEAAAAEVEAQRQAEAAAAAEAIEAASSAAAVAAAYDQGRHDERARILALLEHQQAMLGRSGVNALSLATLRRAIRLEAP